MTQKTHYFTRPLSAIGMAIVVIMALWGLSVSMSATSPEESTDTPVSESASIQEVVAAMSDQERKNLFKTSDWIYQIVMDAPSLTSFKVTEDTTLDDLLYRLEGSKIFLLLTSIEHIQQSPLGPRLKVIMDKDTLTLKEFGLFIEKVRKAAHPSNRDLKAS